MTEVLETKPDERHSGNLKVVLFLEDDADDFVFARHQLKKLKLQNPVLRFPTGDDLMAYLRAQRDGGDRKTSSLPAVIIIDQRLPRSNGLAVQASLRASLQFRKIPLIAISSDDRINALKSAVQLGADAYLTKPFQSKEFLRLAFSLRLPLAFEAERE
jgi:CheY-like chemotaxis protein